MGKSVLVAGCVALIMVSCVPKSGIREVALVGPRHSEQILWHYNVNDEFLIDLVGEPSLNRCRSLMTEGTVTSCTAFVPPCVNVVVFERYAFVELEPDSCRDAMEDGGFGRWHLTCGNKGCGESAFTTK